MSGTFSICRKREAIMSCRPRTDRIVLAGAAFCFVSFMLAGCVNSDLYLDRRDAVRFGAGDAIAANAAMQTIDPWPARGGDTRLAANGQRMQSAVERYRTNAVTPPVDPMMMQVASPMPSSSQNNNNSQSTPPTTTSTAGGGSSTASSSGGGASGQ
jgi:hypothetical protein